MTISGGRLQTNLANSQFHDLYSSQDLTFEGDAVEVDYEIISAENIINNCNNLENKAKITCIKFENNNGFINQKDLTCDALSGDFINNKNVIYNGTGEFTNALTGTGNLILSKTTAINNPAFSNNITMNDVGDLKILSASMSQNNIDMNNGTLIATDNGATRVKQIKLSGGAYKVSSNVSWSNPAPLDNKMLYIDADTVSGQSIDITCLNISNGMFGGRNDVYLPLGKNISKDCNIRYIKDARGSSITHNMKKEIVEHNNFFYLKLSYVPLHKITIHIVDTGGNLVTDTATIEATSNNNTTTATSIGNGTYEVKAVESDKVVLKFSFNGATYSSNNIDVLNFIEDKEITVIANEVIAIPAGSWWTNDGVYDQTFYEALRDGTLGNTIEIDTPQKLAAVAKIVKPNPANLSDQKDFDGVSFELMNDIDLAGHQWTPIGSIDNKFKGSFDGKEHTISNLSVGYINAGAAVPDSTLECTGLFGYTNGAQLSNINLSNVSIDSSVTADNITMYEKFMGSLAGHCIDTDVTNCHAKVKFNGGLQTKGGLIGYFAGSDGNISTLLNCSANVDITGLKDDYDWVGGLIGKAKNADIKSSFSEGVIIPKWRNSSNAGFVSLLENSNIQNCYSSVKLDGKTHTISDFGGFAYEIINSNVDHCYATSDSYGGFMGGFARDIMNNDTTKKVTNCYFEGTLACIGYTSGFAINTKGKVENCYSNFSLNKGYAAHSGYANSGFTIEADTNLNNCYSVADMSLSFIVGESSGGFLQKGGGSNNYTVNKVIKPSVGDTFVGGYAGILEAADATSNYYYSNIEMPTGIIQGGFSDDAIKRVLSTDKKFFYNGETITYHVNEIPGTVTKVELKDGDGTKVTKIDDTTYEVEITKNWGVAKLNGTVSIAHRKLDEVTPGSDVPTGWNFKRSPEDTVMPVSETLYIGKIDFDQETITMPYVSGLRKGDKYGTKQGDSIVYKIEDGDFKNNITFYSPESQFLVKLPQRPEVPKATVNLSADNRILTFRTNPTAPDANKILPNTAYEYSFNRGVSYSSAMSNGNAEVVAPITAVDVANIGINGNIRLRLDSTVSSFRSKAFGDDTVSDTIPVPSPTPNALSVKFYKNDGTNNVYYSTDVAANSVISAPVAPERNGYTFGGWYIDRIAQTAYGFENMVTAHLNLYAKWTKNPDFVTVEFDSDGGTNVPTQSIVYNGKAVSPTAPTKTGHEFAGWYLNNVVYDFTSSVTADIKLAAKWNILKMKVDFYQNDGTNTIYTQSEVDYGQKISAPSNPVRTGWNFEGWYKESTSQNVYDFNQTVIADTNIYAKWTKAPEYVAVTFDSDGGTAVPGQSVLKGQKAQKPTDPVKEGHSFLGWHLGESLYDFNQTVSASLQLKAKWNRLTLKVNFRLNDGSQALHQFADVSYGDKVISPVVPKRNGYLFSGWYLESSCINPYDFNLAVKNNTELYAKWTELPPDAKQFKISLSQNIAGAGKLSGDGVFPENTTITINASPNTGYRFEKWMDEKGVEIKTANHTFALNSEKSFTAYFALNSTGGGGGGGGSSFSEPSSPEPKAKPVEEKIKENHDAYIFGYEDGSFRPDKNITRAETAVIFYRTMNVADNGSSTTFKDVSPNAWYAKEVTALAEKGILKGYENGTFQPEASITRAEFAAIASRYGTVEENAANPFRDVLDSHWAKNAICYAAQKNWVSGYPDGTYRPDSKITRAEAIRILNQQLKRTPDKVTIENEKLNLNKYNDMDNTHWAYYEIMEAANAHKCTMDNEKENWFIEK